MALSNTKMGIYIIFMLTNKEANMSPSTKDMPSDNAICKVGKNFI